MIHLAQTAPIKNPRAGKEWYTRGGQGASKLIQPLFPTPDFPTAHTAAFKPAPLPPESSTSARPMDGSNAGEEDEAPPPPPPTDLRTARKRSSVRALVADDLLSPERVGGLEDEASLGAELGAERGRWREMVNEPNGAGKKVSLGTGRAFLLAW